MFKILAISLSLLWVGSAFAAAPNCNNTFIEGIQGHPRADVNEPASDEMVTVECGSKIVGSGPSLRVITVNNPSGCGTPTCNTANCTANSNVVPELLATFQTSSSSTNVSVGTNATTTIGGTNNAIQSYRTVTVGQNGTLNFSTATSGTTTYKIKTLSIRNGSTVNLQPGDYYIETLTRTNNSGTAAFTVQGTGTARVYIKNDFNSVQITNWNTAGPASKLFIYSFHDFKVSSTSASQMKAVMYVNNDLSFNKVAFTGAIVEEDIYLTGNSIVTYDSNAITDMDFGGYCTKNAPAVTNFNVSAPSTGTNCQNMTVTVTARNSSNQTVTNYVGAITLDTQTGKGTWVSTTGGGSLNSGSNNGLATYQFVTGDNGVASFQLSYPSDGTSPVVVKAYQTNSSGVNGLSGAINFIPSSLLVTDVAVSAPPASPPAAFNTTQTAGNNFTLYLTAYNASNCGIVSSYTGTKTIRFYTTYVNPTSGTLNMKINGTNIASSSGATQTTQSITFTNGVATVTGTYPDAGKLSLTVQDTASGGPSGASGNFVVVPAQFAISIPGNTATQTSSPVNAAVSACLADTVFKKAGAGFTVNVQPQNSQGNVTPNYGNETTAEGIILKSAALVAPNGGRNGSANNGAIGNGTAFAKVTNSAGPFAAAPYFTGTTFTFDEVGCINLTASVASGNYLSSSSNVVSASVVGRFTPDHFDVSGNAPQFGTVNISGAGSFTYLDQLFYYVTQPVMTVTARALAGTTTQNYTGSFWKLTSGGFGTVYNKAYYPVTAGDTIPSLVLSATVPTPTFADSGNGNGTFTYTDGGGLKIQKSATLSPPLTAEIQLKVTTISDSDSIACTGTGCITGGYAFGNTTSGNGMSFSGTDSLQGKRFLHGRLEVVESLGTQNLPLTVPMQTQYYTSNGFVLNTLDSSTVFNGGVTNLTLTPSAGLTTTPTMPSPAIFQSGILNITLSAPSSGGYVDIQAKLSSVGANLPWLQFSWPSSTSDPLGRATFGVFKGSDRIIYQKETVK